MRVLLSVALLFSSAIVTVPSFAQQDEEQALVLTRRASERFRAGELERAAVLLGEAIALHETAALHFNLGRILMRLERWQDARHEYARFVEMEPESPRRSQVESFLSEIQANIDAAERARLEAQARADAEAEAAERAAADSARAGEARAGRPSPAPWIVAGAGILVAAGGIPFVVLSNNAVSRSREAPDQRQAGPPADDARRFIIIADVLFAVGGAAAVTGLVWGLVTRQEPQEPTVSIRPHGAGLLLEGAF